MSQVALVTGLGMVLAALIVAPLAAFIGARRRRAQQRLNRGFERATVASRRHGS